MRKILKTPVTYDQIKDLRIGDTVYLSGELVTCRDAGHRRLLEEGVMPETVDLEGGAVFHAGPIVGKDDDGREYMVSIGPTTSRRMEAVEAEFIEKTGVRLLIGKGGMKQKTADACRRFGAIHCAFPGGCAVIAAREVAEITGCEWRDLGMPEAMWIMKVRGFGPMVVSIDTTGANLFENNKKRYRERLGGLKSGLRGSTEKGSTDMYISEITGSVPADERGPLETAVYEKLTGLGIGFERVDNDSISTMEECDEVGRALGTEICKTIMACTRNKSEYYLIVMPGEKRFESKVASKAIGSSRLSFASAEDMEEMLGTAPGNASPLSVIKDDEGRVKVAVDRVLADSEYIACNVGVNTTHVRIKTEDMLRYLRESGHEAQIIEL